MMAPGSVAIVGAADQSVGGLAVRYSLESAGDVEILDDLQWADWDRAGRLLAHGTTTCLIFQS